MNSGALTMPSAWNRRGSKARTHASSAPSLLILRCSGGATPQLSCPEQVRVTPKSAAAAAVAAALRMEQGRRPYAPFLHRRLPGPFAHAISRLSAMAVSVQTLA